MQRNWLKWGLHGRAPSTFFFFSPYTRAMAMFCWLYNSLWQILNFLFLLFIRKKSVTICYELVGWSFYPEFCSDGSTIVFYLRDFNSVWILKSGCSISSCNGCIRGLVDRCRRLKAYVFYARVIARCLSWVGTSFNDLPPIRVWRHSAPLIRECKCTKVLV